MGLCPSLIHILFVLFRPNINLFCSVLIDEAATKTGDLYIRSVCFSPDGKYLATGAEDKQIRVCVRKSIGVSSVLTDRIFFTWVYY